MNMERKYVIRAYVFDGPSSGGGSQWPDYWGRVVREETLQEALDLVCAEAKATAERSGEYASGDTIVVRVELDDGPSRTCEIEIGCAE